MVLFDRVKRAWDRTLVVSFLLWLFFLGFLVLFNHTPAYTVPFLAACGLLFFLPYLIRWQLILHWDAYRRVLQAFRFVAIGSYIAIQFVGHASVILSGVAAFWSLTLGLAFWYTSEPMTKMATWLWLLFDLGRYPDEIRLFDTRKVLWPGFDRPVRAYLYRFRYDDEWNYGLTGPATVAFRDVAHDGQTAEQIYDAYLALLDDRDDDAMVAESSRD